VTTTATITSDGTIIIDDRLDNEDYVEYDCDEYYDDDDDDEYDVDEWDDEDTEVEGEEI